MSSSNDTEASLESAQHSKDRARGVTHAIRERLDFLDERVWKRFSARRLELIDALELSSRKASEQEQEIKNVAETLRTEFEYGPETFPDFDKLVRAAVQSVRRNRKRSTKSKRSSKYSLDDDGRKRAKTLHESMDRSSLSPEDPLSADTPALSSADSILTAKLHPSVPARPNFVSPVLMSSSKNEATAADPRDFHSLNKYQFISEISKLNSDSQEDTGPHDYPKTKSFSTHDKSREAIHAIIQPRLGKNGSRPTVLPPISNLNLKKPEITAFSLDENREHLYPNQNQTCYLHQPQPHLRQAHRIDPSIGHSHSDLGGPHALSSNISNKVQLHSAWQSRQSPVSSLHQSSTSVTPSFHSTANLSLLNYIERSKTCSEASSVKDLSNLESLGKSAVGCCSAFIFEKSFSNASQSSVEHLRSKFNDKSYISKFYKTLDSNSSAAFGLSEDVATTTLYTLMGGCIKDFGFETIMYTLCEALYYRLTQDYPLISQNSVPFKSYDYLYGNPGKGAYPDSLSSLAEVASEMQHQTTIAKPMKLESSVSMTGAPVPGSSAVDKSSAMTPVSSKSSAGNSAAPSTRSSFMKSGTRKAVTLKFLSQQLEFSYPTTNSAPPKFLELLENAKSAFKLTNYGDSRVLGLRNSKTGQIIGSDLELEKVFKAEESRIELEIFTQPLKAIPIYEITSAILPNKYNDDSPKIILPPPYSDGSPRVPHSLPPQPPRPYSSLLESIPLGQSKPGFQFLSNSDDHVPNSTVPPPPPMLPRFQPLL